MAMVEMKNYFKSIILICYFRQVMLCVYVFYLIMCIILSAFYIVITCVGHA